jgi:zinc/manganese transport system permease protein
VRIAGVLLVFTYLIVPAVCGIHLASSLVKRFIVGCVVALVGGIVGLMASYWWDLPSGAAMVCVFGVLLVAITIVGSLLRTKPSTDRT